jgi:hypothetical protein
MPQYSPEARRGRNDSCGVARALHAQSRVAACGSACGHALEQSSGQPRDFALQFEFEQPSLQRGRGDARARHQCIEAHRIEPECRQQCIFLRLGFSLFHGRLVRLETPLPRERQFLQHVLRGLDQLRALLEQRMAATRLG